MGLRVIGFCGRELLQKRQRFRVLCLLGQHADLFLQLREIVAGLRFDTGRRRDGKKVKPERHEAGELKKVSLQHIAPSKRRERYFLPVLTRVESTDYTDYAD